MAEQWREWWGERTSGPIPTGFVEVRDAAGRSRKASASSIQWGVLGHSDDVRYWRPAKSAELGYR